MWPKRSGVRSAEPKWNLNLVFNLLSFNSSNINISKDYIIMKCSFLLALALGNRISEFHSLLRGSKFIKFARNVKSYRTSYVGVWDCPFNELSTNLMRGLQNLRPTRPIQGITIIPNALILIKDASLIFKRMPVNVFAMFNRIGSPHPLCPVNALRIYFVPIIISHLNYLLTLILLLPVTRAE